MSAAEAIHDRIHGPGHCDPPCGLCREVTGLLGDYAHELAEKQRAQRAPAAVLAVMGYAAIWRQAVDTSADLIDPEVST